MTHLSILISVLSNFISSFFVPAPCVSTSLATDLYIFNYRSNTTVQDNWVVHMRTDTISKEDLFEYVIMTNSECKIFAIY